MRASAKCEMLGKVRPVQDKTIGLWKNGFISIGGGENQRDGFVRANVSPVQGNWLRRGSGEAAIGRVKTQELLDGLRHELALRPQPLLKLHIAREMHDDAADEHHRRNQPDHENL